MRVSFCVSSTFAALAALAMSSCEGEPSTPRAGDWKQPSTQARDVANTSATRDMVERKAGVLEAGARARTTVAPPADATAQALAAYEGTRARLALDDLTGAKAEARKLTAANQPHIALVAAARGFDAAPELTSARSAFGEISRHVIRLLIAQPALRGARTLYFCPMVQGYNKWVQSATPIDNPYLGKRMPRCGIELAAWDATDSASSVL